MNDSSRPVWGETAKRIQRLAQLDRGRKAFGAWRHQYLFGACVTEEMVTDCEARLGVRLPPQLRAYYLELGDGGAGPCYGVKPLHLLEVTDPNYREDEDDPSETSPRYVEVIDVGCAWALCFPCVDPPDDTYWYLDDSYLPAKGNQGWVGRFEAWLDKEFPSFERATELRESGLDEAAISHRLQEAGMGNNPADWVAAGVSAQPAPAAPPPVAYPVWGRVRQRILRLRYLDRQCGAFGARGHQYLFGSPVTPEALAAHESRLGWALPPQLRAYYLELGNGGPGPGYGVLPLEELTVERENLARWFLRATFLGDYTRLIRVVHMGCGHYLLAKSGGAGADEVHDPGPSGRDWLTEFSLWLNVELAVFERAAVLFGQWMEDAEIACTLRREFPDCESVESIIMSLRGNPEAREL